MAGVNEMKSNTNLDVARRVISVIAKTQRIRTQEVNRESTFDDLGIDSLDAFNILFALEQEFRIVIPAEQTKRYRTIGQVIEVIERAVPRRAPGA
jgi:acyl carrier protein